MSAEVIKMSNQDKDRNIALESAIGQIEKAFGKGSVMKLGTSEENLDVQAISTGSLGLDIAVYTDEGKEVDLMQDVNPRRSTPSRPTYESLGASDYEED